MDVSSVDVAIIGGGIVGCSVAFFLRELGFTGSITVFEKDQTYQYASTARSAASIRQQFTTPVNVQMSQFSFAFLNELKDRFGEDGEIALVKAAYLLLADPEREDMLRNCHSIFQELGSQVAWLDQDALAGRFPWLNTEDLVGATYGLAGEGWFDAYMLLRVLRQQAKQRNVTFLEAEIVGIGRKGARVTHVVAKSGDVIPCGIAVNAAGPFAGHIAAMIGCRLPVEPRKRTMFVIQAALQQVGMPFVFDISGMAIRPEGNRFICGVYPSADRDPHAGEDFEPDHYLFEEVLWPALAHRIPALEELRLQSAWCGHYDMNIFDHNGIIGRHPDIENFVFANGFSGHGVMHAPATGRGVAELIVHGRYVSIDLSPLGYERIASNRPLREALVY